MQSPKPSDFTSDFRLLRFRSPLLTEYLRGLFSFGYLDVSVPRVPIPTTTSGYSILTERVGFPIRKPPINNDCIMSHRRFRDLAHVLHRLLIPGHPPVCLIYPQSLYSAKKNLETKRLFRLFYFPVKEQALLGGSSELVTLYYSPISFKWT